MAGYNHYSWCICGWCYKGSINGYRKRAISADFEKMNAADRLSRLHISKSTLNWTSCFVEPNASCPECSAKVYFYQNKYGSRIFFDALGWPWPKHPCTDRCRTRLECKPIKPRELGIISEIMESAQIINFDPNKIFREKYKKNPLDLFIVLENFRNNLKNYVKSKSIFPLEDDVFHFEFTSSNFSPQSGDYFSFDSKEKDIYFLDREALEPKKFCSSRIERNSYDDAFIKHQSLKGISYDSSRTY